MCFKKFQNNKYYSSGSISSERITMAHFYENLTQLCVFYLGVLGMVNTVQLLKNSKGRLVLKEREKNSKKNFCFEVKIGFLTYKSPGRFPFFTSQFLTLWALRRVLSFRMIPIVRMNWTDKHQKHYSENRFATAGIYNSASYSPPAFIIMKIHL